MKTIGLIGGITWRSTLKYYEKLNKLVNERLLGASSARILLYSFNFQEYLNMQEKEEWDALRASVVNAAVGISTAGADFLAICSNTTSMFADDVQKHTGKKVVHIARSVGKGLHKRALRRPLFIGTPLLMESDKYLNIITQEFGIAVLLPEKADRDRIGDIIFKELAEGKVTEDSRSFMHGLCNKFATASEAPADSVVLGCTELAMLFQGEGDEINSFQVPLLDSLDLHVIDIVEESFT